VRVSETRVTDITEIVHTPPCKLSENKVTHVIIPFQKTDPVSLFTLWQTANDFLLVCKCIVIWPVGR